MGATMSRLDDPAQAAPALSAHPEVQLYARHVNPTFVKLLGMLGYGRLFVRARDVWVWDHDERKYLDFLAGFGAVNLGHNHPRLTERLHRFLDEDALNLCHVGPSAQSGELAAALAARTGDSLSVSMFSSSGSEAVEAGLKLARAATHRSGLLFCDGGFHGTNLGTLSVMGSTRLRQPFEPLLKECEKVPFNDLAALQTALATRRFAAFLVEPLQAEAGVLIPASGYLAEAQALCRRYGTLLILDEVQTGLGRTGSMFAYQQANFQPDVLVLAKSLGGGMTPLAATLTSPELHSRAYGAIDRFDLHGSTFAGNALACVCGLESLHVLDDEQLVTRAAERGKQLLAGLRQRLEGHPLVREVRGQGLLVGIELGATERGLLNRLAPWVVESLSKRVIGQWLAVRLVERGIICQPASQQWNVLRFEPPLTVQPGEVTSVVETVAEVFAEYERLGPLVSDVSRRLGRQFAAGWSF
jgi:putrescine aminotransferase